jgi:hypothetical protein
MGYFILLTKAWGQRPTVDLEGVADASLAVTGLCQQVLTLTSLWGSLGNATCGGSTGCSRRE